jgi:membrane protease YdiL (CAAX protease family)
MSTDESPEPPAPAADSPPVPPDRRTADLWLVLAVVLLPAIVSALVSVAWPVKAGGRPSVPGSALNMVAMLAGWVALVGFLVSRGAQPGSHYGLVRPKGTDVVIGACLFLALWQLGSTISSIWGLLFEDAADTNWAESFPHPPDAWWEYAMTSFELLCVGVVEELVWRGYLFTRWEEVTGSSRSALIGTSLLFGFAHLYQGPHGVVSAAAVGFLLCGVFLVLRRLWPVAFAHGLYDFVLTVTV